MQGVARGELTNGRGFFVVWCAIVGEQAAGVVVPDEVPLALAACSGVLQPGAGITVYLPDT